VTVGEPDHNPAAVWAGALRLPSSSAIRRWPQSGGGVSIHTGGRGRGSAQVHQITVGADLDRLGSCGQRAGPRKTPAGMTMCPHRDRPRLCVVRHSYSSRETQTVAITGLLILKGVQPSMWALRVISLTFLVRRKASDKPSDYAPRLLRSAPDPARQRMWPDVRVPDFLGPGQTKSVGMACKRSAVRARLAPPRSEALSPVAGEGLPRLRGTLRGKIVAAPSGLPHRWGLRVDGAKSSCGQYPLLRCRLPATLSYT
jgi:hypothetical protein